VTYVEWLRVRGALKWTAIVFGFCFVALIVLRVYLFSQGGDWLSYVSGVQNDPTSKVTRSVLPDGTKHSVIVSENGKVNITIDDHGYQGQHVVILDSTDHREKGKSVVMGSTHVEALPDGNGSRVTIDTGEPEPFVYYAAIASFVALIVATCLGAPLARENDGHLEVTMTKPISREMLALSTIGVDLAGILGAWLLTIFFLVAGHTMFLPPHFIFGMQDLLGIVLGLLGAFAWYAMLCAITASMKRGFGILLGLAWPFSLIVVGLAKANLGTNPVLQALHLGALAISYIDPFAYLHFGPAYTENGQPQGALAFSAGVEGPALAALFLGYIALAVLQWRRVEA
jgi:hypothetical protein